MERENVRARLGLLWLAASFVLVSPLLLPVPLTHKAWADVVRSTPRAGPAADAAPAETMPDATGSEATLPVTRGAPASSATPHPSSRLYEATSRRSFEDVEYWKAVFDDPARDAWQKPKELVAALGLKPGMQVADVGAGTGYLSRYLSGTVGASGTVLAVETEPNLVAHLRQRAEAESTANVVPILASFDNPRLPTGTIDLALFVDTYHHIDRRLTYFQRLKGALERGGRVAVVDWHRRDLPVGPPPDHKLARDQVVEEMRGAGYALVDEPPVLPYQYVLIFAPK